MQSIFSQSVSLGLLRVGSIASTRSHTATDNYLFFESAAAVPQMHLDTVDWTYKEGPCGPCKVHYECLASSIDLSVQVTVKNLARQAVRLTDLLTRATSESLQGPK